MLMMCWMFEQIQRHCEMFPYFCIVLVSDMRVTSFCWHQLFNSDNLFTGLYPSWEINYKLSSQHTRDVDFLTYEHSPGFF